MEVRSVSRYVRSSPYKCRLAIDLIRNLPVEKARDILSFSNRKAAKLVLKTLDSAIANAEVNNNANIDELYVCAAYVDEAPVMKRMRVRARGRADRVFKRNSHITVVLSDDMLE